jgi:hypothetical protein
MRTLRDAENDRLFWKALAVIVIALLAVAEWRWR